MSNLKEKLTKGGVTAVIVITILAVCYGLRLDCYMWNH